MCQANKHTNLNLECIPSIAFNRTRKDSNAWYYLCLQKRQYEGLADFLNDVARDEVTYCSPSHVCLVSILLQSHDSQLLCAIPLTTACILKVEQLPEYVNLKISVIFCPQLGNATESPGCVEFYLHIEIHFRWLVNTMSQSIGLNTSHVFFASTLNLFSWNE